MVVRWGHADVRMLGIDRDAEHANTAAAYQAGVGAEVVEYRPDLSMLVIGFLSGTALVDADFADPAVMERAADAVRRLHQGPRFTGDFDMFARQAGYLEVVRGQRDRPARRVRRPRGRLGRRTSCADRGTSADRAVQQRPARRELHRRRREVPG